MVVIIIIIIYSCCFIIIIIIIILLLLYYFFLVSSFIFVSLSCYIKQKKNYTWKNKGRQKSALGEKTFHSYNNANNPI